MGNSYSQLATCDPFEISGDTVRPPQSNVRLSRWTARFGVVTSSLPKITKSTSSPTQVNKRPIIRPAIHGDAIGALAAVRPGMVISGGRDKLIALNNIDTGECPLRWHGHDKEITKVAYRNVDGKHYILSGSRDANVKLWQFNTPTTLCTFEGHQMSIMGLAMLEDHQCISGSRDTTLKTWDLNTGTNLRTIRHPRNVVTHISYCHSRNILAQSSEDKELKIWDTKNLELIHQFPKKRHIQTHCDLVSDGNYCLSCSNGFNGDGCEISMWDVRQQKLLREFRGHEESVNCAVYIPQNVTWKRLVISVGADRTTKVWNADDSNCLWTEEIPANADLLACVGFSDGNIVVSGLNATLVHLRLLGKAGRPFLQCASIQSHSLRASSTSQVDRR
ncbi:hypothetical protein AB6A40_004663 [Gnathostoma spinigerum]|uniref:Uncharacterized protein n=1 Tax=Gnathostoma spinigerum TaxID=75299 RepID=A0ABD6ED51_9BILA